MSEYLDGKVWSIVHAVLVFSLFLFLLALLRSLVSVAARKVSISLSFIVAIAVTIGVYIHNQSVIIALAWLGIISLFIISIILLILYKRDTKIWRTAAKDDSYDSYRLYLSKKWPRFRQNKAKKLARIRLREHMLFFALLTQHKHNPLARLPIEIGSAVLQNNFEYPIAISVVIRRNLDRLFGAYKQDADWRKHVIDSASHAQESISKVLKMNFDALGEKGFEQKREASEAYDRADRDIKFAQIRVLDPKALIHEEVLRKAEEKLIALLEDVFAVMAPKQLLRIEAIDSTKQSTTIENTITLAYEPHNFRIYSNSDEGNKYHVLGFDTKWFIEIYLSGRNALKDNIDTRMPENFRVPENLVYQYILVRNYGEFAWRLLRSMGFVISETFSAAPKADEYVSKQEITTITKEIFSEFRQELSGLAEAELAGILTPWFDNWYNVHEEKLVAMFAALEGHIHQSIQDLIDESMSAFVPLIDIGDIDLDPS